MRIPVVVNVNRISLDILKLNIEIVSNQGCERTTEKRFSFQHEFPCCL